MTYRPRGYARATIGGPGAVMMQQFLAKSGRVVLEAYVARMGSMEDPVNREAVRGMLDFLEAKPSSGSRRANGFPTGSDLGVTACTHDGDLAKHGERRVPCARDGGMWQFWRRLRVEPRRNPERKSEPRFDPYAVADQASRGVREDDVRPVVRPER